MLGVVQKFNKNGDFIKSILIKDDIDMIKNEIKNQIMNDLIRQVISLKNEGILPA